MIISLCGVVVCISISLLLLSLQYVALSVSVYPLSSLSSSPSLLKEAEIHAEQREFELNRRRQMGLSASHHSLDNIEFDNKEDDQHDQRLLSQFGIWFLVCNRKPLPRLSIAGRLREGGRGSRDKHVYRQLSLL